MTNQSKETLSVDPIDLIEEDEERHANVHPALRGLINSLAPAPARASYDELVALHQKHLESMLELAQELRQPRLPLGTVVTITVRRLAEMGQESLAAIAKASASEGRA